MKEIVQGIRKNIIFARQCCQICCFPPLKIKSHFSIKRYLSILKILFLSCSPDNFTKKSLITPRYNEPLPRYSVLKRKTHIFPVARFSMIAYINFGPAYYALRSFFHWPCLQHRVSSILLYFTVFCQCDVCATIGL